MSEDDDGLPEERGPNADHDDDIDPPFVPTDPAEVAKLWGPGDFHNVQAEAALLGALMIDNRLAADMSERVKPEHFYEPVHGDIFKAIVRLVGNGKTATPVTLRPIFMHDTRLAQVGGPTYLAQLTGSGAAIIGARDFADQIVELARMRRLYGVMIATVQQMQDTGEIAEAVDALEREIWAAADLYRPIRIHSAADMIGLTEKRIDRIQDTPTATVGVHSQTVPEVNSLLGGLEGGQYTILAGRPSMGKTTLAMSFGWGCAANGEPTLYLHAEMSAELMALKAASDICYSLGTPVEFKRVKSGLLNQAERRMMAEAREKAEQLPLRFADIGRADITRVEAIIARECAYWESRGRKLRLAILDYLGLVQMGDEKDDRRRVSRVSKLWGDILKKYGIHGLALAQLSRKVEDRVATDRRPQLSDLRDSGDLEQDADNVLFIHRPEFYLVDEKPKPNQSKPQLYESQLAEWELDMAEWRDKAEVIAGKNRLGERASRRVKFYGAYSAVRSLTHARTAEDVEEDNLFMAGR